MGLIECASSASAWRGYEYYKNNHVKSVKQIDEDNWESVVKGEQEYHVLVNVKHPRFSKCDCPFANGKRIVCKHMVATYFTVFPKEAEEYYNDVVKAEEEWEAYQEEIDNRIIKCVRSMKKENLQNTLLYLLDSVPEWIKDSFCRENGIYDDDKW